MPNVKLSQRSLNGGEISPEMFGQNDGVKYANCIGLCRNFIPKPQGPAENRSGFGFVREVKDSTKKTRVIPFTYNTTQTMLIELGAGYFRFHTQGATLLYTAPAAWGTGTAYVVGDMRSTAGTNYYCTTAHTSGTFATDLAAGKWYAMPASLVYEIPNPYAESDLFDIHYVQSADVLTLTHPGYAPRELRRNGASIWVLSTISFAAPIAPPTATAVATVAAGTGAVAMVYAVTSVASDGVSESAASATTSCTNNIFTTGNYNTISWGAVTGASLYNVYKRQGGLFGYIGQTDGLSIIDNNIAPDLSKVPPVYESVFAATGDYPGAVSYFEQRRTFAGTVNKPNNFWATRSGTESAMSYSLPIRDDDRISFRVAARESNTIRHIVPLSQLLLLTSSAEWRVTSVNSDAITPTTISVKPQSYIGASNVQPVIVNNTLLYGAARGGHIRELAYNWQASGFITGDLSMRSAHLFDGYDVVDMAYSKAPLPVAWFVSSSGNLLGLTYVPEQQVGAWHWHDTDGVFESCAVVAEGADDVLYAVIGRTIGGVSKRYIERQRPRRFAELEDAFFVDCGLTYSGAPADVISGLDHLEGKTVGVLADGCVHPQRVVSGGSITLDREYSKVHVGLPILADIKTMPVALQLKDGSFAHGHIKNVNKVWLNVYRSSGIFAGPDADHLVEYKQRTNEPWGTPPRLRSDELEVVVEPSWNNHGQVYIRQPYPLPTTIVAITPEVSLG